jgi:hypothetical protein
VEFFRAFAGAALRATGPVVNTYPYPIDVFTLHPLQVRDTFGTFHVRARVLVEPVKGRDFSCAGKPFNRNVYPGPNPVTKPECSGYKPVSSNSAFGKHGPTPDRVAAADTYPTHVES